MLTILDAGLLTTIQDLGRPGHAHLGVSGAGAADPVSLRIGNRLVGNPDGAAALELTLLGGSFRFERDAAIALGGSDFDAVVESPEGRRRPLAPWVAKSVRAGEVLGARSTRSGARAYLCIAGGIGTAPVLGSRSTHLASQLGGADGNPCRAGDRVPLGESKPAGRFRVSVARSEVERRIFRRTLRVTPGAQADRFDAEAHARFRSAEWEVSESADRSGLRLAGSALRPPDGLAARTEGVVCGAVQVAGDGLPIILFVDQQTTGGYAKIATVITADLGSVGQLRPRDRIRFEEVSLTNARLELLQLEDFLVRAVAPA